MSGSFNGYTGYTKNITRDETEIIVYFPHVCHKENELSTDVCWRDFQGWLGSKVIRSQV